MMIKPFPPRLRQRAAHAALALAFGAVLLPAAAGTFVPRSLDTLVAEADTVVIGRARAAETVWAGRNLYTRYTVEVQETLLGTPAREVTVVVEGGVDMNRRHPIAVTVADAPALHRDEPVALLLVRGSALGDAAFRIVGFTQGRIRLATAPDAGAPVRQLAQTRGRLQQAIAQRGKPEGSRRGATPFER